MNKISMEECGKFAQVIFQIWVANTISDRQVPKSAPILSELLNVYTDIYRNTSIVAFDESGKPDYLHYGAGLRGEFGIFSDEMLAKEVGTAATADQASVMMQDYRAAENLGLPLYRRATGEFANQKGEVETRTYHRGVFPCATKIHGEDCMIFLVVVERMNTLLAATDLAIISS